MSTKRPELNGNVRTLIAILIPLLAFGVGYGALRSDVSHNEQQIAAIEKKLDRIIDLLLENR